MVGTIPKPYRDIPLAQFDLSTNALTGSIPESLFVHASNLTILALLNNCLTGSIPDSLCSLRGKRLSVLAMDGLHASPHCRVKLFIPTISTYVLQNPLKGSLPGCLFTDYPELVEIHFSGNGLQGKLPNVDKISSKLTNLTLSHNFFSGTVPEAFWYHPWRNLDLSYNRFTGIMTNISIDLSNEDNHVYSTSSLKLSQNRLSGYLPQVNELQKIKSIDILSGNMFRCDFTNSAHSLPKYDPHYYSYECGSQFTNSAIYVFISVAATMIVVVAIAWYLQTGRPYLAELLREVHEYWVVVTNQPSVDITKLLEDHDEEKYKRKTNSRKTIDYERETTLSIDTKVSEDESLANMRRMAGIYHFSQVCYGVRRWLVFLSFIVFIIFIPTFLSLTTKYSTYQFSYVWQISSAFVSGNVAAGIFFSLVTLTLFCMYSRFTERLWLNVAHLIRNFPLDCQRDYVPPSQRSHDSLRISSYTTRSSSDTGMPDQIPHILAKMSTSLTPRFGVEIPHSGSTCPQKLVLSPWMYDVAWYFRMTCFLAYNMVIVFTVNIGYVYYTSSGSSHFSASEKQLLAIFISLYKICYNAFMITMLRWLGPRKFYILPQLDPSVHVIPHKSNMALVAYMLLISVFNQVFVPAISVMIFSDNCFYNVFVPSGTVSTQLNYEVGAVDQYFILSSGQYIQVQSQYTFSPPFSYSFQCSSQLLVSFSSVFVYRFLIDGLLFPCLLVLLKKWQLWGYARKGWQSNVYQYVTMFLNSSLRPIGLKEWDDVNAPTVFSGDRFTVGLVCDIAIILSFGTAFPVLAIIGAISICVRLVFLQLTIGRVVVMSRQYPHLLEFVERTSNECRKVGRTLLKTLPASMWLISVFWSTFLFDMMGSQGNENPMHKAIWIFLSMALFVPLLIIGTNRCFDYCFLGRQNKKRADVTLQGSFELAESPLQVIPGSRDSERSSE